MNSVYYAEEPSVSGNIPAIISRETWQRKVEEWRVFDTVAKGLSSEIVPGDSHRQVFAGLVDGVAAFLRKWKAAEQRLTAIVSTQTESGPIDNDKELLAIASQIVAAMGMLNASSFKAFDLIDSLESQMSDENLKVLLLQLRHSFLRQSIGAVSGLFPGTTADMLSSESYRS